MNQQKEIISKDSFFDFLQQIEVCTFSRDSSKRRNFGEGLDFIGEFMNFQKKTRILITILKHCKTFYYIFSFPNERTTFEGFTNPELN